MLLITSCADPLRWYYHLVGEHVELLDEEPDHFEYMSLDQGGYINYVLKNEAEIVEIEYDPANRKQQYFERGKS